jgi:hypothetical protein
VILCAKLCGDLFDGLRAVVSLGGVLIEGSNNAAVIIITLLELVRIRLIRLSELALAT